MVESKYQFKNLSANLRRGLFCFWLLGFCLIQNSFAQTQSTPVANFEMDRVIGCAPFTVTPTNLLAGNPILYYFENSVDPASCPNFQSDPGSCFNGRLVTANDIEPLTLPGIYYVAQINGSAPDGSKVSFIEVKVIIPEEPDFQVFTCANNSIYVDLDFTGNEYDSYEINFGDGTAPIIYNKGDNLEDQVDYTFRTIGNFDITVTGRIAGETISCGRKTTRVSSELNVQKPTFKSLTVQNINTLNIQYERIERTFMYELTIAALDGSQTEVIQLNPSAAPEQFNFNNTNYDFANKVYSVSMKVSDFCNNFEDTSELVYTVSTSWQAAYQGNQIQLGITYSTGPDRLTSVVFRENATQIQTFNANTFTVQRLLNDCTDSENYSFIASFGSTTSTSITLRPSLAGVLTPDNVQINTGTLINAAFKIEFDAAPIQTSDYFIFRKDLDGNLQQVGSSASNSFTDVNLDREQIELCYVISYEDNCGNISLPSEERCFIISLSNSALPNAFSPNGDGFNDVFKIDKATFVQFSLSIFNRWGALVFQTTDPTIGWDGNFNNKPAGAGAYVYQIRYTDLNNTNYQQSGNLFLIR